MLFNLVAKHFPIFFFAVLHFVSEKNEDKTSLMEKTLKLCDYLFRVTSNCMRRVTRQFDASLMEKTLNLRDYLFRVTSNCMRCVTRQFDGENIKAA